MSTTVRFGGIDMSDLISRELAILKCKERLYESAVNNVGVICMADDVFGDIAKHRIKDWLEELPSAEHKGNWININPDDDDPEQFGIYVWKCSVCGELFCCKGNYCMQCGARMVSEDD